MRSRTVTSPTRRLPAAFEFIALIGAMMALTALSIDIMLPALPAIGEALRVDNPNDRQLVVTSYLVGFAAGQVIFGPLSDWLGRKPILLGGLLLYAAASVGTLLASDFSTLLFARAVQGIGCASPRVMALAIVRDSFDGRQMARVMSFVMMVFIIAPILAPGIGEFLLAIGPWRVIFAFLLLVSLAIFAWAALRLSETRHPEDREPLSTLWLARAVAQTVSTRQTFGYTLAVGLIFGSLLGYINSAQQVFVGIYDLGTLFPVVFGAIAATLAAAAFLNGRFVESVGIRRLSHAAMIGFTSTATVLWLASLAGSGSPPLWLFCLLLGLNSFCFGFIMPNFNALAMEPLGRIAGTASSFIGASTTGAATAFGWLVGKAFDGTVVPLSTGYTVLGLLALLTVWVTERGRLFRTASR